MTSSSASRRCLTRLEDPPVDQHQAEADGEHAEGVLGPQTLAEKQGAEQDGADGHEEGDEHDVGGAGALEDGEIEHIGQRSAEEGEAGDGQPYVRPPGMGRFQGLSTSSTSGRRRSEEPAVWPAAVMKGGKVAKRRPKTLPKA